MSIILFFDTETSGLFPKSMENNELLPSIIQLSFILYDIDKKEIIDHFNEYIKQNRNTDYNSKGFQVTNITKEMCDSGISIESALKKFYKAYNMASNIVAHNIDFDRKMIQLEALRCNNSELLYLFNDVYNIINNKKIYCTMQMGKDITNIIMKGKYGEFKKGPKLSELHEKLFENVPDGLHDSMIDTYACMKCFMKIKFDLVV